MDWFWKLVGEGRSLAPHGYCLLWDPTLVWTHVVSDAIIGLAYFSIPVALIHFVRRRRDIDFGWVFWLFATFIVACGTTHLMAIWTLWHADYGWEGLVKAITAISSIGTAILLWPLVPKLLAIPSPLELRQQKDELEVTLEQLTQEMARRKRAEEALRQAQKMEAVGQLTGGIAHDFNNLLQGVTGSLSLIAAKPTSEKVSRWAELGREAAERGARLTAQLLAFSRVQRLELRPITIAPLIEGMRDLLASAVGPAYTIETASDGPHLLHVLADPTQIELAVMNLAINARDAMPEGGVIRIATEQVEISEHDAELSVGRYVRIGVTDHGAGMTPEVKQRAFDPFYTTKGVGKGTGLGLSMVYGVARQSGGRAEIDSEPGRGTTVWILLKEVEAEQVGASAAAADAPATARAPVSILLVDDDDSVRAMTAAMLETLGHNVVEADSAEAALRLLPATQADLYLFDFAMPGMNGAELAHRVRASGREAPIVFVTGFAQTDALTGAVGTEAAILRKPFSMSALSRAIAEALDAQDVARAG